MKLTIEKCYDPIDDKNYFNVRKDGEVIKCFHFRPDVPVSDPYNEDSNLKEARELVSRIEAIGSTETIRELVYTNQ